MVAFVENLELTPEALLRVRAQDHRCILGVSHCSKPSKDANLRQVTHDEFKRLESCSKDPIGYRAGPSLYAYVFSMPLAATDPTGFIITETIDKVPLSVILHFRGKGFKIAGY